MTKKKESTDTTKKKVEIKNKRAQQDRQEVNADNKDHDPLADSGMEEERTEEAREESAEEKLAALQDRYLRLSAEFDNYRKRTLKEKTEWTQAVRSDVYSGILQVMDDFDRAMDSVENVRDVEAIKKGVHLIYSKFKDFFKQNGIREMDAIDQDFDTDMHEAVTKIPVEDEDKKGKVVDVISKGYLFNDKVLRYAKVVVGE